jgi:hypothetical protein
MSRRQRGVPARRNVVLKTETHSRLKQFLLELQNEHKNPNMSMDDAVNALLDEHEKR